MEMIMENSYQIYASCVKQENMNNNNNNMDKWVVSTMCQKPCLLFPIHLIILGWTLLVSEQLYKLITVMSDFQDVPSNP